MTVTLTTGEQPAYDWAPEVAKVAALLAGRRASRGMRTPAQGEGQEALNERITPLIDQAVQAVLVETGGRPPCTQALKDGVRSAATFLAAALTEVGHHPEAVAGQGSAQTSPYDELHALWRSQIAALAPRIVAGCPLPGAGGGEPEIADDRAGTGGHARGLTPGAQRFGRHLSGVGSRW